LKELLNERHKSELYQGLRYQSKEICPTNLSVGIDFLNLVYHRLYPVRFLHNLLKMMKQNPTKIFT